MLLKLLRPRAGHLVARSYAQACGATVQKFESLDQFRIHLRSRKKSRDKLEATSLPATLRGYQLVVTTTDRCHVNAALSDRLKIADVAVASANDSRLDESADSSVSWEYEPLVIKNRAHSALEWENLLARIKHDYYTLNHKLQVVMEFLMGRKVYYRCGEDPDVRVDPGWLKSPLFTSFVDFILDNGDVLAWGQPAITVLVRDKEFCNDPEFLAEVLRKCETNTKVLGIPLLRAFIQNPLTPYNKALDFIRLYLSASDFIAGIFQPGLFPHFARVALRNGDLENGLRFLRTWFENLHRTKSRTPSLPIDVFSALFACCGYTDNASQWEENKSIVFAFFSQLRNHGVQLNTEHAKIINRWFKTDPGAQWKTKLFGSRDIRSLRCPATGAKMLSNELSVEEYETLKEAVTPFLLENVMQRLDRASFKKLVSTHEASTHAVKSTSTFLDFILHRGPFDLVMDGMNLILDSSHKGEDPGYIAKNIEETYKLCCNFKKKDPDFNIFIPIRRHLKEQVSQCKHNLREVAHVFFVSDQVYDDSLQLYAAICSGPECLFLSMDFYRDYHRSIATKCGLPVARLFLRYQMSRQIQRRRRRAGFERPPKLQATIQFNSKKNVWHFPFYKVAELNDQTATVPSNWLCIHQG